VRYSTEYLKISFEPVRRKFEKTAVISPDPVLFTLVFGLIDFTFFEDDRVSGLKMSLVFLHTYNDVIHMIKTPVPF
jgi:hypothetical protein